MVFFVTGLITKHIPDDLDLTLEDTQQLQKRELQTRAPPLKKNGYFAPEETSSFVDSFRRFWPLYCIRRLTAVSKHWECCCIFFGVACLALLLDLDGKRPFALCSLLITSLPSKFSPISKMLRPNYLWSSVGRTQVAL